VLFKVFYPCLEAYCLAIRKRLTVAMGMPPFLISTLILETTQITLRQHAQYITLHFP